MQFNDKVVFKIRNPHKLIINNKSVNVSVLSSVVDICFHHFDDKTEIHRKEINW